MRPTTLNEWRAPVLALLCLLVLALVWYGAGEFFDYDPVAHTGSLEDHRSANQPTSFTCRRAAAIKVLFCRDHPVSRKRQAYPRVKSGSLAFSARASWVSRRAPYRFVGVLRWTGRGPRTSEGNPSCRSRLTSMLSRFDGACFDHSVLGFRNFFELQPQGRTQCASGI